MQHEERPAMRAARAQHRRPDWQFKGQGHALHILRYRQQPGLLSRLAHHPWVKFTHNREDWLGIGIGSPIRLVELHAHQPHLVGNEGIQFLQHDQTLHRRGKFCNQPLWQWVDHP
mgnify:CR=1 FL=1